MRKEERWQPQPAGAVIDPFRIAWASEAQGTRSALPARPDRCDGESCAFALSVKQKIPDLAATTIPQTDDTAITIAAARRLLPEVSPCTPRCTCMA